jgi:hypothetical protein
LSNDEDKEKSKSWNKRKQEELQNNKLKFSVPRGIEDILNEKQELQLKKNELRNSWKKNQLRKISKEEALKIYILDLKSHAKYLNKPVKKTIDGKTIVVHPDGRITKDINLDDFL